MLKEMNIGDVVVLADGKSKATLMYKARIPAQYGLFCDMQIFDVETPVLKEGD